MDAVGCHSAKAVLLEEFRRESGRGPAAGVQSIELSAFGFVNDRKQIPSNAVCHGANHAHNGVGGDGSVHGIATLAENADPGLRGEWMFGSNDSVARDHHRPRLRPACGFIVLGQGRHTTQ